MTKNAEQMAAEMGARWLDRHHPGYVVVWDGSPRYGRYLSSEEEQPPLVPVHEPMPEDEPVKAGRKPSVTPMDIEEMRRRRSGGEPQWPIARDYGISRSSVSRYTQGCLEVMRGEA